MSGRIGIPRSARIASASSEVGPFAPSGDHPRLDPVRVLLGDLILAGGEDEDVAGKLEQLLVRDPRARLPLLERAVLLREVAHRVDVEPVGVVEPPETSETAITVAPRSASSCAAMPPTLPKPWTTQRCSARFQPSRSQARAVDHHDAGAGRLVAEDRAADRDRLAGHDLRHRVADLHRVGVHHPGHRLLVRRHVGGRDVLLRADHRQELGGEAAGQPLELARRHLPRVAADAALGAAVGQAQERALPGHPDRERGALAERDLRVVADAALRRAEHARVLDAIAGEDDAALVVHPTGTESMIARSG